MKKVFLACLLLLSPTLYAQDLYEFSLLGGGGLSTLRYEPELGKQKNGLDKVFGLGYTYFFSSYFGLGTGLEITFYNSEYNLKNHKIQYRAKDVENNEFDFTSIVDNYNEKQSIIMLQIPLMLQFQFRSSFYMMVGAKIAVPMSGNISGRADVTNSGYYEEENFEYNKTQEFIGFGKFKKSIDAKDEDFKTSILASVEMGKKWKLDDDIALYIGAYFDYGFKNIYVKKNVEDLPQMVDYNSKYSQSFKLNGITNSQYKEGGVSNAFLDKATLMAIGVKVRIAPVFSENSSDKKESSYSSINIKYVEEEKSYLEKEQERKNASESAFAKQQAEYLARAENLLTEARLIYEKMQNEQNNDAMRISAERLQIEEELKRIAGSAGSENNDTIQIEKPELRAMLPEQQSTGTYAVQVAVLLEESKAKSMVASLKQSGYNAYYVGVNNPGKLTGRYYRVRVGYFNGVPEAENFAKTSLVKSGYTNWWIDKTANDAKSL
jgi:cell division septation protein DedD